MKVISGKYKGLNLKGFDINGTRPTMSTVKESLFATINPYLKNSIVLDLFAGTGALGIEAISQGASEAYFIDNNEMAIKTIKQNTNKIEEKITIIKADALKTIETLKGIKFDIIFLDPPYKDTIINEILEKIIKYEILNNNGIIVCEYENGNIDCSLELLKFKKYGNKKVKIFKK